MNERRIASGKQPDGVARVEESLSTGIYARRKRGITVRRIVARIVEKHDPASRENSRRSRLDEPRIEVAGTCRQHFQRPTVRILERGPVKQIVRRRDEDVRNVVVHPILAVDSGGYEPAVLHFAEDRARLRLDVPILWWKGRPVLRPLHEIGGGRNGKARDPSIPLRI